MTRVGKGFRDFGTVFFLMEEVELPLPPLGMWGFCPPSQCLLQTHCIRVTPGRWMVFS